MKTLHQKETESKISLFDMDHSNIHFIPTEIPEIVLSSNEIHFKKDSYSETDTEIPVNEETRQLFCVGNKGKNPLKVQFSLMEGTKKYLLRVEPSIIFLN